MPETAAKKARLNIDIGGGVNRRLRVLAALTGKGLGDTLTAVLDEALPKPEELSRSLSEPDASEAVA